MRNPNLLGDASIYSAWGSAERWVDVDQKQERLVVNRQAELKYGAKPYRKRKKLRQYENRLISCIKKHKNGKLTTEEYWAKIVQLKADFGMELYKCCYTLSYHL